MFKALCWLRGPCWVGGNDECCWAGLGLALVLGLGSGPAVGLSCPALGMLSVPILVTLSPLAVDLGLWLDASGLPLGSVGGSDS